MKTYGQIYTCTKQTFHDMYHISYLCWKIDKQRWIRILNSFLKYDKFIIQYTCIMNTLCVDSIVFLDSYSNPSSMLICNFVITQNLNYTH